MVFEEATPTTPKPAEPYGTQEMRRTWAFRRVTKSLIARASCAAPRANAISLPQSEPNARRPEIQRRDGAFGQRITHSGDPWERMGRL